MDYSTWQLVAVTAGIVAVYLGYLLSKVQKRLNSLIDFVYERDRQIIKDFNSGKR